MGRYSNRLSDFLFTISRVASMAEYKEESYARPNKTLVNYHNKGNL